MPLLSPQTLARTYTPSPGVDAWEVVQLYRQTQRYSPDWGGQRVATSINDDDDLPFDNVTRSNIRVWVEGDGTPDAARAVDVADELGWLDTEWTPTARALAELVVGVFSCGSVSACDNRPTWTPSDPVVEATLEAALEHVGVGVRHITRDSTSQPNELRPAKHPSILGRALAAAGVPVGGKNAETVGGLPDWLDDAPPAVRASVAEILVRERGGERPQRATRQIQSNRSREYFEDVRQLLEDVTGEPVTASDAGGPISADAVRALGVRRDDGSSGLRR